MNGTTNKENDHGENASWNVAADSSSGPGLDAAELTNRVLRFLSTASNESLGGVAVGLVACTYIVLGRVGLILLGVLGGVVLHASWDGQRATGVSTDVGRMEKGIDVVKRLLDMREEHAKQSPDELTSRTEHDEKAYQDLRPETAAAFNELVDAIIQGYIRWWYNPLLPGEGEFPAAIRGMLTRCITSVSHHISKKRPADAFLDLLTNSSSIVIVFLNELANAISLAPGGDLTLTESVYTYLSSHPESHLKTILDVKQQEQKFRMVADDLLQNFLDKSALECDAARLFLRELLTGLVLEMTLQRCSRPDFINGWIVYLLEDGEPDISQTIDAGMTSANIPPDKNANEMERGLRKQSDESRGHKRRLSGAEGAMEEAMEEARRLSRLIAEEDAKKLYVLPGIVGGEPSHTSDVVLVEKERSVSTQGRQSLDGALTRPTSSSSAYSSSTAVTSPTRSATFTTSDKVLSPAMPLARQTDPLAPRFTTRKTILLTLHNANITIHEDSPGHKGRARTKPNGDYLIQIEPESSQHAGWMIVRKYSDFETLHEVLRRIAQISGATAFTERHLNLPSWKEHSKALLRGELERYLRDSCRIQPLAESEGMKRFLEKNHGQLTMPNSKNMGNGWQAPSTALENVGKGVLNVLTSAPLGAAESGKAVLGGVTGVLGSLAGPKNSNGSSKNTTIHSSTRSSAPSLARMDNMSTSSPRRGRASEDGGRGPSVVQSQPHKNPAMSRRPSQPSLLEEVASEREPRGIASGRSSMSGRHSTTHSRDSSQTPSTRGTPLSSSTHGTDEPHMRLPPPPSNIPDDYEKLPMFEQHSEVPAPTPAISTPTSTTATSTNRSITQEPSKNAPLLSPKRPAAPLSEAETRVTVELLFAVVNELYTLSSAWNIRRTLLNSAKTFLIRPGNPSLSSIRLLIQDSVIASNTSDAGIANHIRKLRESVLPTEEERKSWAKELSKGEKERLRIKARKLLVERGLPTALTGVMGQAATNESMGRVFDCLQMEEMCRGLVFGLLLQGVRVITH